MKFFLYLSIVLFFETDRYIYRTFLQKVPVVWRVLFFVPTVVGLISVVLLLRHVPSNTITTLFVITLFCFTVPKIVFLVFSLVAKLLGFRNRTVYTVVCRIGLVAACVVSLSALYGITFGWKQLDTEYVDLYFEDLPESFDGYRIAHLSDLHLGTYGGKTAYVEKIVRRVNEERPDLVAFTGDIVNRNSEEMDPFVPVLSRLNAPDGVFSVLGNHDYAVYQNCDNDEKAHNCQLTQQAERRMGWTLLMNTHRIIRRDSDSIVIAGMENWGKVERMPRRGDVAKTLKGLSTTQPSAHAPFIVMLQHDPSAWREKILPECHAQLTLSGHTHGGQFSLFGWSPAALAYKE